MHASCSDQEQFVQQMQPDRARGCGRELCDAIASELSGQQALIWLDKRHTYPSRRHECLRLLRTARGNENATYGAVVLSRPIVIIGIRWATITTVAIMMAMVR